MTCQQIDKNTEILDHHYPEVVPTATTARLCVHAMCYELDLPSLRNSPLVDSHLQKATFFNQKTVVSVPWSNVVPLLNHPGSSVLLRGVVVIDRWLSQRRSRVRTPIPVGSMDCYTFGFGQLLYLSLKICSFKPLNGLYGPFPEL